MKLCMELCLRFVTKSSRPLQTHTFMYASKSGEMQHHFSTVQQPVSLLRLVSKTCIVFTLSRACVYVFLIESC